MRRNPILNFLNIMIRIAMQVIQLCTTHEPYNGCNLWDFLGNVERSRMSCRYCYVKTPATGRPMGFANSGAPDSEESEDTGRTRPRDSDGAAAESPVGQCAGPLPYPLAPTDCGAPCPYDSPRLTLATRLVIPAALRIVALACRWLTCA